MVLFIGRKWTYTYMALGVGGLLVLTGGLEWYLVVKKSLLIDTTYSGIALLIVSGEQFWLNFREQSLLRQQIKKQFEHYLDPRQIKRLQEDPLYLNWEERSGTAPTYSQTSGALRLCQSGLPPRKSQNY